MIKIKPNITDVNSKYYKIIDKLVNNKDKVNKNQIICNIETSKAIFEIESPSNGFILFTQDNNIEINIEQPLGIIFDTLDELIAFVPANPQPINKKYTLKALELANKHNIDISSIKQNNLITQKDIEKIINNSKKDYHDPIYYPKHDKKTILIVGGGKGATQVLDILNDYNDNIVVGILDDNSEKWGQFINGIPIVGGIKKLKELFDQKYCTHVIISISTSIEARQKIYEICQYLKIPLINAIDKTCKISNSAIFGNGNVICAFCHIGAHTIIGDNNFISTYNSFDHHCVLGNNCSTGPGCISSGIVKIGNNVKMGTGIFIEPYLEIGNNVQIASGSIILHSIPNDNIIKTKIFTTIMVKK